MTSPLNYLTHPLHSMLEPVRLLKKSKLWFQVLVALFLGIIVGIFLGPDAGLVSEQASESITLWLAFPGNLFLQLIKMIIIPLIVSSIILGIVASGDPSFLKRIGPRLVVYFLITTTIATIIGFLVAFMIQPGNYIDASNFDVGDVGVNQTNQTAINFQGIPDTVVNLLPSNPLAAVVNGDLLGVVIFTILFGVALLLVKPMYRKPAAKVLRAVQDATMKIVGWAMLIAPLAVFGLMTRLTSTLGVQAFVGLGMYAVTVIFGLILMVVVYLLIVWLLAAQSPIEFIKAIAPVQLLAFSTSSSAAVMPLSMKTAEEKLGVKPAISRFLIPVGATINMDGTALYQVVATVFLSQVFEVSLPLTAMIAIVALTVGASVGAPAAPGIGIVILATILESVGIPGAGIALILGVDRILDMSRTSVNVTGDLTACAFFNRRGAHLFEDGRK